jgi:hypothetical protein
MNQDIFADWKSHRFVRVGFELLNQPAIVIVLTDIAFWAKNADELNQWCCTYGARVSGMTVEFDNEKDLSLFCLRWA